MILKELKGNRIMVTPLEEAVESKIILSTVSKDVPITGRIDMLGDTATGNLVEGDIVLFSKFSGQELKVGDKKVLIMPADSIIGIVDPQSINLVESK